MMSGWWVEKRTIRAAISISGGLLGAAAAAYLIWAQLDPSVAISWLVLTSIGITFLVAVGSTTMRAIRIQLIGKQEAKREKVATHLRSLRYTVVKMLGEAGTVDVLRDLGASAYRVGGPPWSPRLKRIGRERTSNLIPHSGIVWTEGKGVVGRCWETRRFQVREPSTFDEKCRNVVTPEQWAEVDAVQRMGLSFAEYEQIRDKYGTVIAAPIIDPGTEAVVGVVSLDAPPGYHELLKEDAVRDAVGQTAGYIAGIITA